MAARYSAGQYEDAFSAHRLQNWSVARPGRQRPSPREGSTTIIADDRGHLLPAVPRSQASPWGRFVGTWEMPSRIPPARLDLTSRAVTAATRVTGWVRQPTALTHACNGLQTEITGKPQQPRSDTRTAKEPSRRRSRASGEGIQPAGVSPGVPLEELPCPGAGAMAAAPLSSEPGCTEAWLKVNASPEPPAAHQPCSRQGTWGQTPCSHQPAVTDRRGDTGSPKIPALIHATPSRASPQQATLLPVPTPSPGGMSPGLRALPCVGQGEASPGGTATVQRAGQPSCAGL
ncbi:protein Flattop isoform X1 [Opisthocomus hoazin]|uniref:protein Flattop isoform X1 n=1 Tax=Opisthocomus hoazin TaxID=30419 RepID=UPI003F52DC93